MSFQILEFKILANFKISADFQTFAFQIHEFKIFTDFKILVFQNP